MQEVRSGNRLRRFSLPVPFQHRTRYWPEYRKGEPDETVGVSGVPTKIYRHNVSLHVLGNIFKIRAGFTDQLPLAGLLGRVGFFEHFKITFDPSSNPPGFDLERIYRA
jgi:hypothetical protein